MIPSEDYFYSLCRKKEEAKKVKCLKRKNIFLGSIYNKICSKCSRKNNQATITGPLTF